MPGKKITSIANALGSVDLASLELTASEMHEIRGEAEIVVGKQIYGAFTVFKVEVYATNLRVPKDTR